MGVKIVRLIKPRHVRKMVNGCTDYIVRFAMVSTRQRAQRVETIDLIGGSAN